MSSDAVDLFAEMPELTLSPIDFDEGAADAAAASPPPDESKSASGVGADPWDDDALDKIYMDAGMQLPSIAADDEEPEEEPVVEEKQSRSKAATSATGKKGRGRPRKAAAPKDDDDEADEDFEPEKKSSGKKKATAAAAKKRGASSVGVAGAKKEAAKPRGGKKTAAAGGRKRKSSPAREVEDEEAEEAVESEPDDFEAELAAASKFKSRARAPAARGRAGKAPLSLDFDVDVEEDDTMDLSQDSSQAIQAIDHQLKMLKEHTAESSAKRRKIVAQTKQIVVDHGHRTIEMFEEVFAKILKQAHTQVAKTHSAYNKTIEHSKAVVSASVDELRSGVTGLKKLASELNNSWKDAEKMAEDGGMDLRTRTDEYAAQLRKINADFAAKFESNLAKLEKGTIKSTRARIIA